MNIPKKTRWLQVAKRASEFRLLQGSHEVAEANERAEVAQASLEASQRLTRQTQREWRERLSKPAFHAGDDAQFRHFQKTLKEAELRHDQAAERARAELEIAQMALRVQLAEKNALQAALQNVVERFRLQETATVQKEADDIWAITQNKRGAAP